MGPQRPHLVGLICWILIIGGFGGLALALKSTGGPKFAESMEMYPYPANVAETLLFLPLVLMVIAGICMYEGQGWARFLYIAAMPFFFVHRYLAMTITPALPALPVDPQKVLLHKAALGLAAVLYLVSILILFLRQARRYFKPPLYVDE